MSRDDGGSATVLVIVMLPLLLGMFAAVIQMGAIRVIAARVASAADLATLAAVDDQDEAILVRQGVLRLSADADAVARRYFALNLDQIAAHLAVTPEAAAQQAAVGAFPDPPAVDPLTGWRYDRPTVRLAAKVPVRTPAFAVLLLPTTVTIDVRAASSAR